MQEKIEGLIRAIYGKWKQGRPQEGEHPGEELLACFAQGKLSAQEQQGIKAHIISCTQCAEALSIALGPQEEAMEVPQGALERLADLLPKQGSESVLEIILRLKERMLEIINTTGDVLLGQELVPAPVLRSRNIKGFRDEVTILKDFKDIRVEVKVENKVAGAFNLFIVVKQKQTQKIIKDLRVTLLKDDTELESYLTDAGSVTFEHVSLGKYKLEISTLQERLASVLLDIKI